LRKSPAKSHCGGRDAGAGSGDAEGDLLAGGGNAVDIEQRKSVGFELEFIDTAAVA
jgi:hypothetical protein